METTTNRLSSAKWSRNLNQDVQSEANRLRLLERQRQLIESKLQRRQQEEHKNMNIVSTPSTTSTGGSVSSLSRPATAGITNLRGRSAVFSRQKSSTDLSSLDGDARDDQNSLDSSGGIDYDLELKKDTIRSNRARTSLPGNRTLISSLDSTATTRTFLNNKNNESDNVAGFKASSDGSKPKVMVSGPLMNRSDSPKVKNFRDNRSLSKSEVNLNSALNGDGKNGNIEQSTVQSLINTKLPTPNPLQTVLTDSELLKFVSHPVSPDITLQCTIIRDKKGLDRSFYPTYYMHLQDIVPNNVATKSPMMEKSNKSNDGTGKVEGTATVWLSDSLESINSNDAETDQESLEAEPLKMANKNSLERDRNDQTFAGAKKVFVLSGRRRKKSKTYLIGNNAFDISREKCIAKLKSNVLGTQFTAIRLHQNGVRYEIASITYETNVLGFKGPRKMTIIIPKPDEKTNALCHLSLQEELKRNSRAILLLKNKTPIWNEETQSYVLNFHGRVTQASVKNFQLVVQDGKNGKNSEKSLDEMRRSASSQQLNHNQRFSNSNSNFDNDDDEDDDDDDDVDSGDEQFKRNKNNNNNLQNHNSNLHSSGMQKSKSGYLTASSSEDAKQIADTDDLVSLQFGRVSNTNFSCDVSYPLSLLQAFAIALSSFDSKLACE